MTVITKGSVLSDVKEMFQIVRGRAVLEQKNSEFSIPLSAGHVFGEWKLANLRFQDKIKVIDDIELKELKDPEDFLKKNPEILKNLLIRSFRRLERADTQISEGAVSGTSATRKYFFKIKGPHWVEFPMLESNDPYFAARKAIAQGDHEMALKFLNRIDISHLENILRAEVSVWRVYCHYLIGKRDSLRELEFLHLKFKDVGKLLSYRFMKLFTSSKPIPPILDLYVKCGYMIPSRTVLFHEGSEGEEAFLILSGSVRIARFRESEENLLAVLGKGQLVGEMAVLGNMQRTATVYIQYPCQIIVLPRKAVHTLVVEHPSMTIEMIKKELKRVDATLNLKDTIMDPAKRFKMFISEYSPEDLNEMRLTVKELAKILDTTTEEVGKLINNINATLSPKGIIKFKED